MTPAEATALETLVTREASESYTLTPTDRRRLHELGDAFGVDKCLAVLEARAGYEIADPVARLAALLPGRTTPNFPSKDAAGEEYAP